MTELAERLRAAIGAAKVLTDPAQLRTYECDGLEAFRVRPGVVVLAGSTPGDAAYATASRLASTFA